MVDKCCHQWYSFRAHPVSPMVFLDFRPYPRLGILSTFSQIAQDHPRAMYNIIYLSFRMSLYNYTALRRREKYPAQRSPHASLDCNFSKLLALLFMGFEEQVYSRAHRVPCDHAGEHLIQ
jgi:hypothetical protein